jgi:hypothetical protein
MIRVRVAKEELCSEERKRGRLLGIIKEGRGS